MAEKQRKKTKGPKLLKKTSRSKRSQNTHKTPTRNFGRYGIEDVCLQAKYTLTIKKIPDVDV